MAADQTGPHWADPLKVWGDVLMKLNQSRDAVAEYGEVLKYAPNWLQLKKARAGALTKMVPGSACFWGASLGGNLNRVMTGGGAPVKSGRLGSPAPYRPLGEFRDAFHNVILTVPPHSSRSRIRCCVRPSIFRRFCKR